MNTDIDVSQIITETAPKKPAPAVIFTAGADP